MINFALVKVWYWIAGVLAVLLLAALAVAGWQYGRAEHAKKEQAEVQGQLNLARQSLQGFKTAAEECDAGVKRLMAEHNKKLEEGAELLKRAQVLTAKYQASDRELAKILNAPTPTGAKCSQAIQRIRQELKK